MRNRILISVTGLALAAGLAGCGTSVADGLSVVPAADTEANQPVVNPAVSHAVQVITPLCPSLTPTQVSQEVQDFVNFVENGTDPHGNRQLLRQNVSSLISALELKCGVDWSETEIQSVGKAVRQLIG